MTGADLLMLAELVDTSWIYWTPDARYQIHELPRQYLAEKLAETPSGEAETQDRHAAFYLQQAAQRQTTLIGPDQRAALDAIAAEIDNLHAAWDRAVAQRAWPLIGASLHALYLFFFTRGRYVEGEEMLAHALYGLETSAAHSAANGAPDHTPLRCRLLARLGVFHLSQGNLTAAECSFDTVLSQSDDRSELAFVYAHIGALARLRGNRPAAESALQQTITLARASGDRNQMAEALHILSDIVASFADFEESKRLAQEALALCRELQRPDLTARVLASTGWAVNCLGDYALSEHYYRESLAISEAIGDPYGIALSTNFLGWVAFCAGGERLAQAVAFYERALAIWRHIGQRTNIAMCLGDYGLAAYELGDLCLGFLAVGLGLDKIDAGGSHRHTGGQR
ncbi:MAG: tetratricopeptide repeat protein [Caldilineaceae bacterium]|nr:tetratricopeptide repeat protein [Caldilineaceae bacterium]